MIINPSHSAECCSLYRVQEGQVSVSGAGAGGQEQDSKEHAEEHEEHDEEHTILRKLDFVTNFTGCNSS